MLHMPFCKQCARQSMGLQDKIRITSVGSLGALLEWRASIDKHSKVAVVYLHGRDRFNDHDISLLRFEYHAIVLVFFDTQGSDRTLHLVQSLLLSEYMGEFEYWPTEIAMYVPEIGTETPTLDGMAELRLGLKVLKKSIPKHLQAQYAMSVTTYVRFYFLLRPRAMFIDHSDEDENDSVHFALSLLLCRTYLFTAVSKANAFNCEQKPDPFNRERKTARRKCSPMEHTGGKVGEIYNYAYASDMGFHRPSASGMWIGCPRSVNLDLSHAVFSKTYMAVSGSAHVDSKSYSENQCKSPSMIQTEQIPIMYSPDKMVKQSLFKTIGIFEESYTNINASAEILDALEYFLWPHPILTVCTVDNAVPVRYIECNNVPALNNIYVFSINMANTAATVLYSFQIAKKNSSTPIFLHHRSALGN